MAGPTLLDLGTIADEIAATDVLYLVRGVGAGRDKQFTGDLVIPTILTQNVTAAVNLNLYKGNVVIFSTPAAAITLTFANMIPNGRKLVVVNKSTDQLITLAGTGAGIILPNDQTKYVSDGTTLFEETYRLNINAVVANYIILDDDGYEIIEVTTAAVDRTVTMPTLADNLGRTITINKVDVGVGEIIVDGEGAETINGLTSIRLRKQNYSIKLYGSLTEWKIISTNNELMKARRNIKDIVADYTITDIDGVEVVGVTTAAVDRTITLPTLADNQERIIEVYKEDFSLGDAIVDGEGAETINGELTLKLPRQYSKASLIATPTEWKILSIYYPIADTGWINRNDWTTVTLGNVEVTYDNLAVSSFIVGEIVTCSTGPTGKIIGVTEIAGAGTLTVEQVTGGGVFPDPATLLGSISGSTADVDVSSKNVDTNINHLLDADMSKIFCRLFISENAAFDATTVEVGSYGDVTSVRSFMWLYIDANNIIGQTPATGIDIIRAGGAVLTVDNEDWYYKIVAYKIA